MTRPASKSVTIIDIAREAGVSPQTVSRVINNKEDVSDTTRSRIQELIVEMGYRPNRAARGLVSQRSGVIGLIIHNMSNPYYAEVARGVEEIVLERDYNVLVYNSSTKPEKEEKALNLLEEAQVDGVILFSPNLPHEQLCPLLERQNSAVIIDEEIRGKRISGIRIETGKSAYQATELLLKAGRRNLLHVTHSRYFDTYSLRGQGMQSAMTDHGIRPDALLILSCKEEPMIIYRDTRRFLEENPEVDGILCHNDMFAISALKACHDLGRRVPEDIAVVGHGDIAYCQLVTPTLTTLREPKYDLGVLAAQRLFDLLDGKPADEQITITPELVVRESTP